MVVEGGGLFFSEFCWPQNLGCFETFPSRPLLIRFLVLITIYKVQMFIYLINHYPGPLCVQTGLEFSSFREQRD